MTERLWLDNRAHCPVSSKKASRANERKRAMSAKEATISARLDRLPATRTIWWLVTLLSIGAFFEIYDFFLNTYIVPGLVKSGLLAGVRIGIFSGPATFFAATFGGLFIGTIVFGFAADRFGRRFIFAFSLLWYSLATIIMAFQTSTPLLDFWRFIAGIGIGVELVTIDTYIAELVPKHIRGRAYAFSQTVQFSVVPVVALLAYYLVPRQPFGLDGWRVVVLIGGTGAVVVWFLRRGLPESPRWLLQHGRFAEAERVTAEIEARVKRDLGGVELPPPLATAAEERETSGRFGEIWQAPYRARAIMMMVFQFFQTIGYYGFASWVPTLIAEKGFNLKGSLLYAFLIAIANPLGPLLAMTFADRIERKWLIVASAAAIGLFGIGFAAAPSAWLIIACGLLITLAGNIFSFAFHAYQSELFPTRMRARAVGFVYSWSRLSAVFASFLIGWFLKEGGVPAVFALIGAAMLAVVISIGGFGPKTSGLQLEEIAH
ncbi:MAG: MFS transporter [Acidobacteriia bacterium]|nr:MFS transporter [Methyloceanibacter sp.]MCL6492593.1 MFS transporter [Terriglobia bacterium]